MNNELDYKTSEKGSGNIKEDFGIDTRVKLRDAMKSENKAKKHVDIILLILILVVLVIFILVR